MRKKKKGTIKERGTKQSFGEPDYCARNIERGAEGLGVLRGEVLKSKQEIYSLDIAWSFFGDIRKEESRQHSRENK